MGRPEIREVQVGGTVKLGQYSLVNNFVNTTNTSEENFVMTYNYVQTTNHVSLNSCLAKKFFFGKFIFSGEAYFWVN